MAERQTPENGNSHDSSQGSRTYTSQPPSPTHGRRSRPGTRMHSRRQSGLEEADETTALLPRQSSRLKFSNSTNPFSRVPSMRTEQSFTSSTRAPRHHNRTNSWSQRLRDTFTERHESMIESKGSIHSDERVWYDQFTSTDWVHDSIADAYRVKALRSRKGVRGRVHLLWDGAQGWILSAVVGFVVAVLAYGVDVSEQVTFDFKDGYCAKAWYLSERRCCPLGTCTDWHDWGEVFKGRPFGEQWTEFIVYIAWVVGLAMLACLLTLSTKTVVPSSYRFSTMDENLAAERPSQQAHHEANEDEVSDEQQPSTPSVAAGGPMVYYSAAGSGVAEVRVILSGFVLHGFLGLKTLVIKSVGLVLSVASGLSLGKEGPYVHIATCVGNIACRMFSKYDSNDAKRREILSAAAAAGVAVAFGAPLGGVLFCLEEVAYFFPAKTLFRTFFCCITAALTLKFLDPYGTHKIVMFQVHYSKDWEYFELVLFVVVGILGGALGALFIKASRRWAMTFRKIRFIKSYPLLEVGLVAVVTALTSYWNVMTKLPVAKLLFNLAAPCDSSDRTRDHLGLCPKGAEDIPAILTNLLIAFVIKSVLTTVTFGIKVPAGIYVPSMVVGGLMGRLVGHLVQWVVFSFPELSIWDNCAVRGDATCIQPGVYALIAAGSTMCGVTRLSVTLAVILFELTGSLDYVLPFSLAILVAKWTADAIEPLSVYDLLTEMNSYPFLNNKHKPVFTSTLADIVPRVRKTRIIDITNSPLVSAMTLRNKLDFLHKAGELDGGLPIIRDGALVGLIPAPDLEYALDNLPLGGSHMCLMTDVPRVVNDVSDDDEAEPDPNDFTRFIDPAPMALDVHSPMDLVYECFVKLGLRYICVLRDGKYAGMTHKKTFVKYVQEIEISEGHV